MINEIRTVYELVGGDTFFHKLAETLYGKIDKDDLLRHMFPENLELATKWNYLFLRKIFGGPDDYVSQRGNPMMRKRHLPFKIGLEERNRWLKLMLESMEEVGINDEPRRIMSKYFEMMATKMVNQPIFLDDYN